MLTSVIIRSDFLSFCSQAQLLFVMEPQNWEHLKFFPVTLPVMMLCKISLELPAQ